MGQSWTLSSKRPATSGGVKFNNLRIAENEPLKPAIKINYL